jgi:hypothetical protein
MVRTFLPLLAAVLTWLTLFSCFPIFKVGSEFGIGMSAPIEQRLALLNEEFRIERLNACVLFAIGGFLLSVAMSIHDCGQKSCLRNLGLAAALGILMGGLSGYLGKTVYSWLLPKDSFPNTINTGIAQAAVFAIFGLFVGALYGAPKVGKSAALVNGFFGAFAGAMGGLAFPIVTGILFPQQNISTFLQPSFAGLLWLGLPFAFIGGTIVSISSKPHIKKCETSSE